jgi:hypothetical protein
MIEISPVEVINNRLKVSGLLPMAYAITPEIARARNM